MNFHMIIGAILFVLASVQLLPVIRRGMAERGLSGSVGIPLTLALIGFVTFVVGALLG